MAKAAIFDRDHKTLQKDFHKKARNKAGERRIKKFVSGVEVDLSDVPIHLFEKLLYHNFYNEIVLTKCFIDEIFYRIEY